MILLVWHQAGYVACIKIVLQQSFIKGFLTVTWHKIRADRLENWPVEWKPRAELAETRTINSVCDWVYLFFLLVVFLQFNRRIAELKGHLRLISMIVIIEIDWLLNLNECGYSASCYPSTMLTYMHSDESTDVKLMSSYLNNVSLDAARQLRCWIEQYSIVVTERWYHQCGVMSFWLCNFLCIFG